MEEEEEEEKEEEWAAVAVKSARSRVVCRKITAAAEEDEEDVGGCGDGRSRFALLAGDSPASAGKCRRVAGESAGGVRAELALPTFELLWLVPMLLL